MDKKGKFNIKAVSKLVGLSDHTIRAWERRYSALTPERTNTNRRLYSEEDIEKLSLLSEAVNSGHTISNIANYNIPDLRRLTKKNIDSQNANEINAEESFTELIKQSIGSIIEFDRAGFEKYLMQASLEFSKQKMLTGFIIPLLTEIGELWANGKIRIMHEHFASSVLRTFTGNLIDGNLNPAEAPKLITTTPEGFFHELGALIAAVYAMDFGWNSVFLGPNLPAEEISAAVIKNKATAVLLSLIYPKDEPHTGNQLHKLRKYLGENFPIILVGQSASSYAKFSNENGCHLIDKIVDLKDVLQEIRS
jgi:DNA-binding transcriptional MerR regulator